MSEEDNPVPRKKRNPSKRKLMLILGIVFAVVISVFLYSNRSGYFIVKICDESGANCFNNEARVDPEWVSKKQVSVKSKSVFYDQRDRDVIRTYECDEFGKPGGCRNENGRPLTIYKVQRL